MFVCLFVESNRAQRSEQAYILNMNRIQSWEYFFLFKDFIFGSKSQDSRITACHIKSTEHITPVADSIVFLMRTISLKKFTSKKLYWTQIKSYIWNNGNSLHFILPQHYTSFIPTIQPFSFIKKVLPTPFLSVVYYCMINFNSRL